MIFAPVLYFVALLIPVVVPGPGASLLLVSYAKKKQLSIIHFVLLLVLDGLSLFLIIVTRGLGSYDLACVTLPFVIFVSCRILFSTTLIQIGQEDLEFRKRIDVGVISILFLQIVICAIATGINTE